MSMPFEVWMGLWYYAVTMEYLENMYDPDPTDEHYEATILYLIRALW